MPEWTQIFLQLGFPTASLILVVWKGIPWIQEVYASHKAEIRELIDSHLAKIEEKDKDLKEIHEHSMKIIEANTRAINALASDVGSLKETNAKINQQLSRTNELIEILKRFNDAS